MHIAKYIVLLSMGVFLFLPFRQYKSRLFYYFYIMALEDPFSYYVVQNFGLSAMVAHIFCASFLAVAMLKPAGFSKLFFYALPCNIIICYVLLRIPPSALRIILAAIHLVILLGVFIHAAIFARDTSGINFFHIVLVLLESSTIIKLLFYVFDLRNGVLNFFLSTAFEILIGVFFLIFREDDKKLVFMLHPEFAAEEKEEES